MGKKKLARFFLVTVGIIFGLFLVSSVCYAIPQTINYQGYLTDSEGYPLDGTVDMVFALYNVASGGSSLWSETQTEVDVTEGIFSVNVGSAEPVMNPIPDNLFADNDNLYLGVTVGTDSEMTPRQPVTSVGYAYRAGIADAVTAGGVDASMLAEDAVTADKIDDGAIGSAHLVTGAVTTDKLDNNAVTSAKIMDNSVTYYDIVDGSGSFLDADTLDGYHGGDFMMAGSDNWVDESGDTMSGKLEITVGTGDGLSSTTWSSTGRGVYGCASYTTGTNYGVYGESNSTSGYGVYGEAPLYGVYGSSNSGHGVYGESSSTSGYGGVYGKAPLYGVWGYATAATGTAQGVRGESFSTSGRGVYGMAWASTGTTYGVYGRSYSPDGRGVYGLADADSGTNYGVYGQSNSTSGWDFWAGGQGNYGAFTGAHEAKLSSDFPGEVEPGLIVTATGQAQKRHNTDGSVNLSTTLPTVKLADQSHDKAVFGVLVAETTLHEDHWYDAGEGERFAAVNALGEGRVWVTNCNGAIEAGDYITTSAIPGYGQRQDDDLLHSYTLGKAIETVDWDQATEIVEIDGKTHKVYLIAVVYTSG